MSQASPSARVRSLGAVLYPRFELLDLYGPLEMFGALGPELRRRGLEELWRRVAEPD